jgi:hypothetical protein
MKSIHSITHIGPDIRQKLFWAAILALAVSVGVYIFFVNTTIRNIVHKTAAEREALDVRSNLFSLEYEYLALSAKIDYTEVGARGLRDITAPAFITLEKHAGNNLSFRNTESR